MEDFFDYLTIFAYYLGIVTFIWLIVYGVFMVGVSIYQLFRFLIGPWNKRQTMFLILAQLLHGAITFGVGVVLYFQLEMTLLSSLGLLIFSWIYTTAEHFVRGWYTTRFVDAVSERY